MHIPNYPTPKLKLSMMKNPNQIKAKLHLTPIVIEKVTTIPLVTNQDSVIFPKGKKNRNKEGKSISSKNKICKNSLKEFFVNSSKTQGQTKEVKNKDHNISIKKIRKSSIPKE